MVCLLVGLVYRKEIAGLVELWQLSDIVSDRLSGEQGTSGGDHIRVDTRGALTLGQPQPALWLQASDSQVPPESWAISLGITNTETFTTCTCLCLLNSDYLRSFFS